MARKITVIPKAPFGRILMRAGAKRVSADAMNVFTEILIEKTEEIATPNAIFEKRIDLKTDT